MRPYQLSVALLAVVLTAGCGRAPSGPSQVSSASAQMVVGAAVTEALSKAAVVAPFSGDVVQGVTMPCPDGGTIKLTYSAAMPTGPGSTLTTSSKTEFDNCKSQNVTIQGDPYLESSGEHVVGPIVNNQPSTLTSTMRTTGGLRFEATGTQGRARYNCTQVMSITFGSNGLPTISTTSSGTITWEQPLGTVTTRPCGPS